MQVLLKTLSSLLCLMLFLTAGCSVAQNAEQIANFEQCVSAGNPVLKTLPARCVANGQVHVDTKTARGVEAMCVNACGNGKCEEIVCMAQGCPCAENALTCPQDCKK